MQSIDEARVKIEELKAEIEKNNKLYYEDDNPIISDYDYDMMMRQLISLEDKYPELKTPDSPSNRVGGKALSKFEQIRHDRVMMSLSNAFTSGELRDFDSKIKEYTKNPKYVVEFKIDGLTLVLKYEKGIFNFHHEQSAFLHFKCADIN